MKTINTLYLIMALIVLFSTVSSKISYASSTAIASLQKVAGKINIKAHGGNKSTIGNSGTLLYPRDLVTSRANSKATIVFRDGTELRLFENSELLIEKAMEVKSEKRSFLYDLTLKAGAIWGNFIHGRQKSRIRTGLATIGVKGTVFRVSEIDEKATISVTEGVVSVDNSVSSVNVQSGKWIKDFSDSDDLKEKVEDIPHKLHLKTENYYLDLNKNKKEIVRLSIQMIDLKKGGNIQRSGPLLLTSNYYNTILPENIRLDANGFTRVPIDILPPATGDQDFDGKIIIRALMDGATFSDVGEGSILLKVEIPGKTRKYIIDANDGNVINVK